MATEAIEQVPAAEEAAPAKTGGGSRNVLILAVAGLIAGSGVGLFGVGPVLAKRKARASAAPKVRRGQVGGHARAREPRAQSRGERRHALPDGDRGVRAQGRGDRAVHEGSRSRGSRSHARAARQEDGRGAHRARRSASSIKKQVLDVVAPLFPKGAVLKVFFPQFVIQ